jgi:hypothetical protein
MNVSQLVTSGIAVAVMAGSSAIPAFAASTIVVTPTNTTGWSTSDTRPGGAVNYVADATAPAGSAALQLTTDATTTAKAQYLHDANTLLSNVSELSYYTKQNSALFPQGDPSYQLPVYLNGGTNGFTTFVFEPYENLGNNANAAVVPGVWQKWDVASGQLWSSRSVTCSNGAVLAGGGGAPFYTLNQIETMCPEAMVAGFGVNIGSNNPLYNVETDLVSFNGTAYNFELTNSPTTKQQCKDGGYATLSDSGGNSFKNQGQCVSYVEHHN